MWIMLWVSIRATEMNPGALTIFKGGLRLQAGGLRLRRLPGALDAMMLSTAGNEMI